MKANEAPEKIYLHIRPNKEIGSTWHGDKISEISDTDIEYTRTDAFIEKVARFLEYNLNDRVEIQVWGTLIPSLTSKKAFIEDFRKYMEGE